MVAHFSLRLRITQTTLAIFLVSLWSLLYYLSQTLRDDMSQVLEEQQSSTVAMVASQLDHEVTQRISALETVARLAGEAIERGPKATQDFLEQHDDLRDLFGGGIFTVLPDGVRTAYSPYEARRFGVNLKDRDYIIGPVRNGKTTVGTPIIGRTEHTAVVVMGTPVWNKQGQVIGVLACSVLMSRHNFLDRITENRYGKTGGYLLISPQARVVITATDKTRVMEPLPPPGVAPLIDRFVEGHEGSGVLVSPHNVEEFVSAKYLQSVNWYVVGILPTAEAFVPIQVMQRRMMFSTIVLTLFAGVLTWGMLRRQLFPLQRTTLTLEEMSASDRELSPLPVDRHDEIGQLLASFNRLIDARKKTLQELQASKHQYDKMAEQLPVGIYILRSTTTGRITTDYVSPRASELFGVGVDALLSDFLTVHAIVHPEDRQQLDEIYNDAHAKVLPIEWEGRIMRHGNPDDVIWLRLKSQPEEQENGDVLWHGIIEDVTERHAYEQKLKKAADYDALTGLPNRALLGDRLRQGMAQARRRDTRLAVAFLDLDHFKEINDAFGHAAGDRVLIVVSEQMRKTMREGDTVARMGGDEFVLVIFDLTEDRAAPELIMRMSKAVSEPIIVDGLSLHVSCSIGVTFYPQDVDLDADHLLRQADQAMYQAKLAGRNGYHVFDADEDRDLRSVQELVQSLQHAIVNNELVLHYQPKVDMRAGKVVGAEALIRWQHPAKGLLTPFAFLPRIENHPISLSIGEWVIQTALKQMKTWQANGLGVTVSVNVGAYQLQHGKFVEKLRCHLAACPDIPPETLTIELVESSALNDIDQVAQVITEAKALGVLFSLDDFGTGYSSLTYLKRLNADQIKIDQSFVRDMLDDPEDLRILEGVISLAAAFGREVIAEGVETDEHGEMLLQMGCNLAQGYGIAQPMSADDFAAWALAWQPNPSWRNVACMRNEDERRLLFARTECRAWVIAFEQRLRGKMLAKTSLSCAPEYRLGEWLNSDVFARYGADPVFVRIKELHEQLHLLGEELSALDQDEAVCRLGELYDVRDSLLAAMKRLAQ